MMSFKSYLKEQTPVNEMREFKAHLKKILSGTKFTESNREKTYHVRFPVVGNEKQVNDYFKKLNIEIKDYDKKPISSSFSTKLLVLTKDVNRKLTAGTSIPWVNNYAGAAKTGNRIFGNKELNPESLGLAGKTLTAVEIIKIVETELQKKYDQEIAQNLIDILNSANTKNYEIPVKLSFSTYDLSRISADFGEIMSAIWSQKNLGFKKSFFPVASNERLIDFYGVRFGVNYPISVKSGEGGKVTVQNIIDAINNRVKTANSKEINKEPALGIFKIVNEMPMKNQMIELHKYMNTEGIKKLSSIMNVSVRNITLEAVENFVNSVSKEVLIAKLEPFWRVLNTQLTEKTKQGDDRLRLIISPLGESIWKVLNKDKEIRDSLTRIARKVTLIQINVDVMKTKIRFDNNYFKEAEFQFGWAGYSAKNKLGFKMNLTK